MQTYGKNANGSIVLFQHRVFCEGHQCCGFGELCALGGASFSNEEPGSRTHVIYESDDRKEYRKDGEDQ